MPASLRRPSPKLLPQAAASASRPSAFVRRHLLDLLSSCAVYLARPCPTGPSISVASASICARLFGTPPNPTLPRPMRASTCPPCLGSPPRYGPGGDGRPVRAAADLVFFLVQSGIVAEWRQNSGRMAAELSCPRSPQSDSCNRRSPDSAAAPYNCHSWILPVATHFHPDPARAGRHWTITQFRRVAIPSP